MSFTIDGTNGFVAKLDKGGARSSLFAVELTPPTTLGQSGNADLYQYMCKGVQLPADTIGVITVNYFGRAVRLPGNRSYEDMSTTIINDEGYPVRNMIELWMNKINDHKGNVRDSSFYNKSQYQGEMKVKSYKKDGDVDKTYKLSNCFPTSVDAIEMAWEPNEAVMEFTVNWAYDYWELVANAS